MKDLFCRQNNITDQWTKESSLRPLCIDIGNASICGIALSGPIEGISFLGPSDFIENRTACLSYKDLGLSFTSHAGKLASIDVAVHLEGWKPYKGKLYYNGSIVKMDKKTSVEAVKGILGDPARVWDDGSERSVVYTRGGLDTQFVWASSGILKTISFEKCEPTGQP